MDEFERVDEKAARKLQAAMFNAIMEQIKEDPLKVSAATLGIAEKILARWNVGLEESFMTGETELTPEEQQMMEEFAELEIDLNTDTFDKPED